ncbi:hypothetical protein AAC387_Pa07g1952 [Persea americana]
MCSKRLCDSERNEGASGRFKTEPRSSGRSFVILGGSVKLDAGKLGLRDDPVRFFQVSDGQKNRTHCRGFKAVSNRASFFGQFVREILGGSVKLDAVILISHKSLFGYALCKAL